MMRNLVWLVALLPVMAACDNTKEQGKQTVRQLSGSQMLEQEKAMKQQLEKAQEQQADKLKQLDQEGGD